LPSIAMMPATQPVSFDVDELERLVKRVEPAAFLVPPRLLRRVIRQHRQIGGLVVLVPHRTGYGLEREALLNYVQPAELGLASSDEVPSYAFLMIRPDPDRLARHTPAAALLNYWQILFHLHIDQEMQQKLANGSLSATVVRTRIGRLGFTEFAEITAVLREENYLLPPETPESVYAEFVAVYLTLRRFDPARAAHFFPALRDLAAVDALLAEDIDADAIYQATRLPGAEADGEKGRQGDKETGRQGDEKNEGDDPGSVSPCLPVSPSPLLDGISARLQQALELSDAEAERWREALRPLVASAGGAWSQEARLLADLRSVCIDSEHGVYTVDLVGWALSLGQLPIKRPLLGSQEVAIVRHLRRALDRMRLVNVADTERQRLTEVLTHAMEQRERRMRERFRPLIASALDDVGLKTPHVAEEIARAKLIDELLDRVEDYGHFSVGTLRDAVSRNQMKLPDITGPVELVTGDPLIRLNRKLAIALDGVYRRGEFYLRLLHRLSSVAFGTALGRLLVLFLILPFGLAYFTLITPDIVVEEGGELLHLVGLLPTPPVIEGKHHGAKHAFPLPNWWGVAGLGIFFLLLFHVAGFRSRFFYGVGKLGHGLQTVFVDGLLGLLRSQTLQAILHNPIWRAFRRFVIWPTLMAFNGGLIAWLNDADPPVIAGAAASCLVLGIVLLNTRVGRDAEETATDWCLRFWVWFSIDFLPGLVHMIMDLSRWCLDGVEQLLYLVNEWLRLRSGENRVVIAAKAVLGVFWFGVTYVIRFAINLLIEPQVNPIKHFPVVTLAHKVCLPMTPVLHDFLVAQLGLLHARAWALAGGIITSIPGIFGFMVWELKENWKLYAANRPPNLKPAPIGSHGETMLRLLRPGFHSGTIPKLFTRLRRAERYDQQNTVRKILAALHHVEESIGRFIERELLALLRRSKPFAGLSIEAAPIRLATNRVVVELRCPVLGENPLVFAFDHQSGWLLAGVLDLGWLPRLNAEERQTLAAAFAGLYKLAGVDLVREQITASLPPPTFAFDITEIGLLVWPAADGAQGVAYDLTAGDESPPQPLGGAASAGMPVLDARKLMFSHVPLAWADWVHEWDGGHANGKHGASDLLPTVQEGAAIEQP
jgi:hypothetical protein